MLNGLMVVTVLQCTPIPEHYTVHATYIQFLFVNHMSKKLEKNKCLKCICKQMNEWLGNKRRLWSRGTLPGRGCRADAKAEVEGALGEARWRRVPATWIKQVRGSDSPGPTRNNWKNLPLRNRWVSDRKNKDSSRSPTAKGQWGAGGDLIYLLIL